MTGPSTALAALVQQWRDRADRLARGPATTEDAYVQGRIDCAQVCADELQALLEALPRCTCESDKGWENCEVHGGED